MINWGMTERNWLVRRRFFAGVLVLGLFSMLLGACQKERNPDPECLHTQKQMQYSGENHAVLRMTYTGCACGVDYPQYVVDSVLFSESEDETYFINKEFSVVFPDTVTESALAASGTSTKSDYFIFEGTTQRNSFGMNRLLLEKGEKVEKKD